MTDLEKENNLTAAPFDTPCTVDELGTSAAHFGRMNDPTSSAVVVGPCGDMMEFYLVIENNIITDIRFYTEGCLPTVACGEIVSRLAENKTVSDSLSISPLKVMKSIADLPDSHSHCPILAVSSLYKAVATYMLMY